MTVYKNTTNFRINRTLSIVAFIFVTIVSLFALNSGVAYGASEEEIIYDKAIAHGGGFFQGYETTNSREAILDSMERGFRYIELDMDISKDNKIVIIHDWVKTAEHYYGESYPNKLTSNEFSNILVNGKYTTLNFDDLVEILAEADKEIPEEERIKIVTDTKGDNLGLLTKIATEYPEMIPRIIPQIYDYDQYEPVAKLGFEEIILTIYNMPSESIDRAYLLKFAKEKDLFAVTVAVDYYLKGVDTYLASNGVRVYSHPIDTLEEAKELFSKGIYGVYSGLLSPAELTGKASGFYLLQTDSDSGKSVKLTDATIPKATASMLRAIGLAGVGGAGTDFYAEYEFDGKAMTDQLVSGSDPGRHEMIIKIISKTEREVVATLRYPLWISEEDVRVVDAKFEYRFDQLIPVPDLRERLAAAFGNYADTSLGKKMIGILENSFIASAGDCYFYNEGESARFMLEEELLTAQKYKTGKALVPLADGVRALGASNVKMDSGKYIYVELDHKRTLVQANSRFAARGITVTEMKTPVTIYRRKAMASGEFLSLLTGREYIDKEGLLILLPEDVKLTSSEEQMLIDKAKALYKNS